MNKIYVNLFTQIEENANQKKKKKIAWCRKTVNGKNKQTNQYEGKNYYNNNKSEQIGN